jgi:F0F1-type ATP synthase membrane subunit b/b'
MSNRCERCEQMAAELRAELRAEFDQLREGLVRRIDEIFDHISAAVADIKAINRGLLADVDRSVQRLIDQLSERLLLPPQRTDEEPPRPH